MDPKFAIYSFTSLLAILNPFGALPVFLSLASSASPREQKSIIRTCVIATFVILVVFMLLGNGILQLFGIQLSAFRAGGGILILLMGISMLHGGFSNVKHTRQEAAESAERDSIAVVPLAIPILAGPGSISTIILLTDTAGSFGNHVMLLLALLACMVIIYLLLGMAQRVQRYIGRVGLNVFSRIMGLILVAIAVQFIADGLGELLPGLRPAIPPIPG